RRAEAVRHQHFATLAFKSERSRARQRITTEKAAANEAATFDILATEVTDRLGDPRLWSACVYQYDRSRRRNPRATRAVCGGTCLPIARACSRSTQRLRKLDRWCLDRRRLLLRHWLNHRDERRGRGRGRGHGWRRKLFLWGRSYGRRGWRGWRGRRYR